MGHDSVCWNLTTKFVVDEWSVGKNIEKYWRSEFDPCFFWGPGFFLFWHTSCKPSSALGIFREYSSFKWRYRKKSTNLQSRTCQKIVPFRLAAVFLWRFFFRWQTPTVSLSDSLWNMAKHFSLRKPSFIGCERYHHHSWLNKVFSNKPLKWNYFRSAPSFSRGYGKKKSISTFACADVYPNPWALPPTNILENKNNTFKHPHISDVCPSWCFFQ